MFVRWLGAFGQGTSLSDAANWEMSQVERQVAAEPLWRGKSLISHVKIGLMIDESRSVFCSGWTYDAWTLPDTAGVLRHAARGHGKRLRRFKDLDRFSAAWKKMAPDHHGEVAFDAIVYKAIAVKRSASEHGLNRARRLAETIGLPIVFVEDIEK